ncbi:MAG: hypothetical protein P4L74_00745 [Candidatus Doudnabacteria bacterium]|nr:hypothetical protein [Candidatus Doudnabacteria bacterium]
MWQNWVNMILGLWVIVAGYLYVPSGSGQTLMYITGLIVAILAVWALASESGDSRQMEH